MSVEDNKRYYLKSYRFWSQLHARCYELAIDALHGGYLAAARVSQETAANAYKTATTCREIYLKISE